MDAENRYDVVGDVHGMIATFRALLAELGYRRGGKGWEHSEGRRLVQVGDLLDRGPDPLGCAELMEELVRDGVGEHVLGNHELNAVAWFYGAREHTDAKRRAFHPTLAQIEAEPRRWERVEAFLRERPLLLSRFGARFVHASWPEDEGAALPPTLADERHIRETRKGGELRAPVEFALKGPETLPGEPFYDEGGELRRRRRIAWWRRYPAEAPPVYFGHYWLRGAPRMLGPGGNAICLDYSCGVGGPIAAFRAPEGAFVLAANRDVPDRRGPTRPEAEPL
ncbi:MAG TPA: metallophosphoesterase [Planctomycetota bacterium]|nr:metallophosphoesterase [Planctomycetota bacterium]